MKRKKLLVCMMATVIFATACGTKKQSQMMDGQFEAVYLGVQGYGEEETNKDNKESFLYRFDIKGAESIFSIDNGTKDEEGEYDYPIQNALKEGYSYQITVNGGIVVAAEETKETQKEPETIVSGQPFIFMAEDGTGRMSVRPCRPEPGNQEAVCNSVR